MASHTDVLGTAQAEFAKHPTESWGTNYGPDVARYQRVTMAFRVAWCVSFFQYCLWKNGLGPVADRTAGVWYLWGYARTHGWATQHPQPGFGCILPGLNRSGHMGIVESVEGSLVHTIEGNSGNTVQKHTRSITEFIGFVDYPAKDAVPPKKKPPLFQVVVGDGPKAHVVAIGPWGQLNARVPKLILHGYTHVQVKRKWRV